MGEIDLQKYINALELARKALEFYGDEKTYDRVQMTTPIDLDHHGHQARYVLETIDTILNPDYSAIENALKIAKEYETLIQENENMKDSTSFLNIQIIEFKKEYDDLIASGIFFEMYPDLIGIWEKDKIQFINSKL